MSVDMPEELLQALRRLEREVERLKTIESFSGTSFPEPLIDDACNILFDDECDILYES